MQQVTFEQVPSAIGEILRRLERMENILQTIASAEPVQPPAPPPDAMTIQEAAEFLNVAVPTMYNRVYRREIPHSKRNNKLYFSREKLTAWLLRGEVVRDVQPPMTGLVLDAVRRQVGHE